MKIPCSLGKICSIDDFAFDSTQTIDNFDNKLAEYTEFKIDSREYPESLMKNDPNVISEFDSIIKEKHESDYIFESSNNNQWIIIRSRNEAFSFDRLKDDLRIFKAKHFETYEANQSDMSNDMWKELKNTLLYNNEYSKRFVITKEKIGKRKKIEIYGLKNDIESLRSKLEENEKNRNKNIVRELKRLSEWQTKYFERFVDYKHIIEEIDEDLTIEISGKKITFYGEINSVDEAFDDIEHIFESIERKELEVEPKSLAEYLKSTDLSKLNRLIEENALKIMVTKSEGSIHMIGRSESDFKEFKQLITNRFCTQDYTIDKSLIYLIKSPKFKESVEKKQIELNIPDNELMIVFTEDGIRCTGEKQLVDEIFIHVIKYTEENKILSHNYTRRYPEKIIEYFERVIYDELERELNKDIDDSDLEMKKVLQLNSSDKSSGLLIIVPFKYSYMVAKYLNILDHYAYKMIEEDYSIHNKFPLSEIIDPKEISESIKSIEKRTRCLISQNIEVIDLTLDSSPFNSLDGKKCRYYTVVYEDNLGCDFDHIVQVKPANQNEGIDFTVMKVLFDINQFLLRYPEFIDRKILVVFCRKQHHNYDIVGLIDRVIFNIVELITGLPMFDYLLELITFVSEDQNILIQPFLDKILRVKSRYKNEKRFDNLNYYPETNALKFTMRSDSKECIEKCIFELNEMAKRLSEPMKCEIRCYQSFKQSKTDHIIEVGKICSENNAKYKWDFANRAILIFGRKENVDTAVKEVDTKAEEYNKAKNFSQYIKEKVRWEKFEKGQWEPFSESLNAELEMKHMFCGNKNSKIRLLDRYNRFFEADVKENKLTYDVDLGLRHYEIRRVELTKMSLLKDALWTSTKDYEVVRLDPNSVLYNETLGVFVSMGLIYRNILSIDRIENRFLYTQYISHKQLLMNKYTSGSQIEYNLFHGTSDDSVENISKHGFDRSYAGKNATAYGKGVYFARFASYSHNYTDIQKGKPVGHMFLCRVLVGSWALGDSSMSRPPQNKESTSDNLHNPSMFVVYKDAQAYPDYLLTYQ